MTDLIQHLTPHYKSKFVSTETVINDLKLIKKLNVLFGKLERSKKDIYVLEIINILKTLNNVLYLEKILLLLYSYVDIEYHSTLDYAIKKVIK